MNSFYLFNKYIIMFWMLEIATEHFYLLLVGIKINSRHWIYNIQKEINFSTFPKLRAEYPESNQSRTKRDKWASNGFFYHILFKLIMCIYYFYRANSAKPTMTIQTFKESYSRIIYCPISQLINNTSQGFHDFRD